MTSKLVSQQQVHQSRLTEHFSIFDAWRLGSIPSPAPGVPSLGYLPQIVSGQKQGFGMVYGMVQAQAAMLSFNDIYLILAIMTFLMIPSFLLLRGARSGGGGATH
jgi:hypothetical protein